MKKLVLFLITSFSFFFMYSQDKSEILDELFQTYQSNKCDAHLNTPEVYYNVEQKILDFESNLIDLDLVTIGYDYEIKDGGILHFLDIQCISESCIIDPDWSSPEGSKVFGKGFCFNNKKSVYEVIDLLYALKKLH